MDWQNEIKGEILNLRKSQNTSKSERSNVEHSLWRKKVDNSLFRHEGTAVPRWVASMWQLEKYFPDNNGFLSKRDKTSFTKIILNKETYNGHVTCVYPKRRANKVHRLWISEELSDEIKKIFVMSHMRDIESAIRKDVGDIEKEIPFWEFIDIEFNPKKREFVFTPHYTQGALFPKLFKNLSSSPAIKTIEDSIINKDDFRIYKQDWKPRENLENEIGAVNAIYTLLDKKNKLIYVGEAKDLRKRLKQSYKNIPNWTHYRYEVLPKNTSTKIRVAIERMMIRSYASIFKSKSKVQSVEISSFLLANDKIDK